MGRQGTYASTEPTAITPFPVAGEEGYQAPVAPSLPLFHLRQHANFMTSAQVRTRKQ